MKRTGEIDEVMQVALWLFAGAFAAACALFRLPTTLLAVGLTLLSLPIALIEWGKWRRRGSRWGGIMLIYPAAFAVAYSLGSMSLARRGAFGVDPDSTQWLLYAAGLAAFLVGGSIRSSTGPDRPAADDRGYSATLARVIGGAGLLMSLAIFHAQGVPLLAGSVDAARFQMDTSQIAHATNFVVGALQFGLVVLLLEQAYARRAGARVPMADTLLSLAFAASLAAWASRTFLVLPLVAVAIVLLERKVAKVRHVVLAALIAFATLTGYSYYRHVESGTARNLEAALQTSGLAQYPLASGILSLQVGPRVFQVTREQIPSQDPYQHGSFFLADGSVLLRTHSMPSDYFTTTKILGRNYAEVGGSPPTVLGGFYIDGGVPLMVGGMVAIGFLTRRFRSAYLARPHVYRAAAYGYWSAWMLHSLYNYVSLKPMVLTFLLACLAGSVLGRRQEPAGQRQAAAVAARSPLARR